MDGRWCRSVVSGVVLSVSAVAFWPSVASAHDVTGSRFDAPLPLSLLFAGAAATVGLTALWLAFTDRSRETAADQHPQTQTLLTVDEGVARRLELVFGGLFFAGFLATLVAGFLGRQVAAENFATVFTWPVWVRGLALVAILAGSPWQVLSPWRSLYRLLCWLEGRELAALGSYPERLGNWPALVGFFLLVGVVENLTVVPQSPTLTAALVAAYALWMLVGAVAVGPAWFAHADPLGLFYRLFGRVSGVHVSQTADGARSVGVRPPWRGCRRPVADLAVVVFAVAAVYTVSFDGFTDTRRYQSVLFAVRDTLGTGAPTSVLLYVAGLVGFTVAFIWTIALCDRLGGTAGSVTTATDGGVRTTWLAPVRQFAPTVLPIAAAYEVAHNYPYVVRGTAQLVDIAARPLVQFGTLAPLDWLSLPVFWGSQVALVVVGHVVAVVAAHRVARDRYTSLIAVRRGHLPLVLLMIGYTMLSLWIVSQPVVS